MENEQDMLSRVQLMAGGNAKWDLSDNDCAALKFVLAQLAAAVSQVQLKDSRYREAERQREDLKTKLAAAVERAERAEVERNAIQTEILASEQYKRLTAACQQRDTFMARAEAAEDTVAGLRDALEKIASMDYKCAATNAMGYLAWKLATTALSATPSQHAARLRAKVLREAAEKLVTVYGEPQAGWALLQMADEAEKEAQG